MMYYMASVYCPFVHKTINKSEKTFNDMQIRQKIIFNITIGFKTYLLNWYYDICLYLACNVIRRLKQFIDLKTFYISVTQI